ncbi:RIP metalloprotease RseP [Enterococcus faecalis]|uniref:RIP metalloprotease RseP n=1 Tax=Enterococcus faecalis TaxID=1351 RepID=UPI001144D4CC|nr:RIP metalloprotease RseP [Enterococcus faecalis]EIA6620861.1 RIP metalloprotease RseP [Enterococcus faecalis]MBP4076416.1 RIP metalloprotease RseP [Enterococcus faecalis]MBP4094338.1 RIP metalloprotease RseP [Enterococcus faecalis]MUN81803.1 RIP metalloprotease RseP [Enterococcus faecalis]NGG29747.1 RIP metalloprotease RseP [Enterococcus faecalis]
MKTIITFIIVFGILVLVHEFGHFYFAKRAGILVREFAIGMGPKIFAHRGKDGTTYTIRLLPIGGYVRMAGMGEDMTEITPGMPLSVELNAVGNVVKINTSKKVQLPHSISMEVIDFDLEKELFIKGYVNGNEEEETVYKVDHDATIIESDGTEVRIAPLDVQFQSAKLSQRILTNFAGPMNNFILGFILFTLAVFLQGGVTDLNTNQIGQVIPNGPAAEAGLKENDKVLSINNQKIKKYEDFTTIVQKNPEKPLTFIVERNGKEEQLTVTPEKQKVEKQTIGKVGVYPYMKTDLPSKLMGGIQDTLNSTTQIFKALGSLFTGFSLNKLGGPVMMFKLSEEASNAGVSTVVFLMAMLSMNLGIINLLPIPALDGGKIVLNIIEGVRGKPISPEKEGIITLIGFGFVMVLMVLVTWNDIQRFFF